MKENNTIETKIKKFRVSVYEPEHEEGQTCWCKPKTTVDPSIKKAFIDHQEQRGVLTKMYGDLLYDFSENLFDAGEYCSNQDSYETREWMEGFYAAIEYISEHSELPSMTTGKRVYK